MYTVLEHINAFWMSHGDWITIAFIPTIIAGLTLSPKTTKAAGLVPKIWDVVKLVMGFLSLLTHKDQPGTFKLPLKSAVTKEVSEDIMDDVVVDVETPKKEEGKE